MEPRFRNIGNEVYLCVEEILKSVYVENVT